MSAPPPPQPSSLLSSARLLTRESFALARSPLVGSYFTRLPQNATTKKHDQASLALANNGWIWDADPLANFAERPSKAYLRREVMCV